MSEQRKVLALKYRPKRFEDLVGQGTISQTLSLALDTNRLSHAYLFSGLRGSGKTSTARIMAKALLCENGPTSKPCDVCSNCKSANENRHLDIIEMDAASNRGIDDIKDLIEHTKYKPSSARFKVFIIDEVHMLTTQAFNALLKTLEEPPGFVKFILATTDALKLPATILSRTQQFRFKRINDKDVIHHLSHILNEEGLDYESEALDIIARSGQGSLRDTLTLLDQAIIYSKGKVTTTAVVDMLGLIDPLFMDKIFDAILNKGDISSLVHSLEEYEAAAVCDEMSIYLKQKMLFRDPKFDVLIFDRFFRVLGDAKHLLALNSDSSFVMLLTLMKLQEAVKLKTIDEIINQVENIEVKHPLIEAVNKETVTVHAAVDKNHVYNPSTNTTTHLSQEIKPTYEIKEEIARKREVQTFDLEKEETKDIPKQVTKLVEDMQEVGSTTLYEDDKSFEKETEVIEVKPEPREEVKVENANDYPNPFDEVASASIKEMLQQEELVNNAFDNSVTANEPELKEIVEEEIKVEPIFEETKEELVQEEIKEDSNPFEDDFVSANVNSLENITSTPEVSISEVSINEVVTSTIEELNTASVENEIPLPMEKTNITESKELTKEEKLYEALTKRVYDRSYDLGECFKKNFIMDSFVDDKLVINSSAQGEDKKFLYNNYSIIKIFIADVFGDQVEIDFIKTHPIVKKKTLIEELSNDFVEAGSMIEDIEMGSGCVADMQKTQNPTPAQKELEMEDILNSKMLNKAKELFDVKKITVRAKS